MTVFTLVSVLHIDNPISRFLSSFRILCRLCRKMILCIFAAAVIDNCVLYIVISSEME